MEQPTKQKSVNDADYDGRFSDLPDEMVHHILSFLQMRDLSRLSVVSRRCRELCISNPHLDLSNIDLINSDESSRSRFYSFVDRLISLRCMHRVKRQTFRLRWSFVAGGGGGDEYRVATWLQHAVNMGVERVNLELVFDLGKPFDLPLCFLGCNSLRQLKVDAGDGFVKLPSSYFAATNLQTLTLGPVRIEKGCNVGELLSSFKSLKRLSLDKISGIKSMTFTSPSVETLRLATYDDELCNISIVQEKLQDLFIYWTSKSGSKSLTIYAPNLKKFYWKGSAVDYYNCLRDLSHLLHAGMNLSFPTHQASCKHIFDKILHSIQRAKCLSISESFVEVLLKQGCLPFLFDNLEYLTVSRTSRGDLVLPLCSLLRGTFNLKHLTVSCLSTRGFANVTNSMPSGEFSFKMGYWQSQNLMFTRQLKTVALELSDREHEVELIKYLLKNAEELEVMNILCTSPVSSDLITEIRKYKKPSTKLRLWSTISYIKMHYFCVDHFI
ncbi:hypothetical protein FH972_005421 [Carpinus fangiana]|uniref:F-box domain-containing protein n=1 Tax=Carpinus fangiana TaxID=176857 RepID=A0A5N6QS43_9ROSI|nr:hypothetical protein FH972_005421 [Carpinus fangiana]